MWPVLLVAAGVEALRALAHSAANRRNQEHRDLVQRQARAALALRQFRCEHRWRQTAAVLDKAFGASTDPLWRSELERIRAK